MYTRTLIFQTEWDMLLWWPSNACLVD